MPFTPPCRMRSLALRLLTPALLLAAAAPAPAATGVYSSGDLALAIPDPGVVEHAITVPDAGLVEDVTVRIRLDHPSDDDLELSLVGPDGTTVVLANHQGAEDGANFGAGSRDCRGSRTAARSASRSGSPEPAAAMRPAASTWTSVGQARMANSCQTRMPESTTTGYVIPYRRTACRTMSSSRSFGNFGEWTPTTTNGSSASSRSSAASTGSVCRQLIQQEVQKSSRRTRPARSLGSSSRSTLSQRASVGSAGARTAIGRSVYPAVSCGQTRRHREASVSGSCTSRRAREVARKPWWSSTMRTQATAPWWQRAPGGGYG